MIRRLPATFVLAAAVAILVAACNGGSAGPALTDPKAIVTAAIKSTDAARSVHLDIAVDGTATIALPIGGGTGTPVNLTGTTASADIDLTKTAAKGTFSVPALLGFGGAVDPSHARGLIDNLGDLLLKPGVTLVKGADVACGPRQCYTATADLTATDLGTTGTGAIGGLPVDLTGATLKVTVRVERDLPNHLAGVTAVLSMPNGSALTVELAASKWDEPVSITAPPADQVKPTK